MFRKHNLFSYLKFASIPALIYTVIAVIFVWNSAFQMTYILYIGNMLFGLAIAIFIWLYNKHRKEDASTSKLIFAGHISTVMAILIICIINIILMYIMPSHISGDIQASNPQLQESPPQMGHLNRGLVLVLFMNAIVGNVSTGSFISILLPYTIKRNQKGDMAVIKDGDKTLKV